MIEKLAEEEQPKSKNKSLHSPATALRGSAVAVAAADPELLSLTTSAEQAAGRAALVVLIKSENGQNTSNAQSVGSQPGPHTLVTRHRYRTPRLQETLHVLGSVPSVGTSGRKTAPLKGEDQQPDPSLSCG